MTNLPVLSGHDVIKALGKIGFQVRRQKGSHIILANGSSKPKRMVVVPNHKEIDTGTLVEIMRQSGLKREDFLALL